MRPVAMMTPDLAMIAEVMLAAEGFREARILAKKTVTLYNLMIQQLSKQVCQAALSCYHLVARRMARWPVLAHRKHRPRQVGVDPHKHRPVNHPAHRPRVR